MEIMVMTLDELMSLPPADRALAASMALKAPMPQAEGAWPAGTPVRKRNSAPGDHHKDGSMARVVGSLWIAPTVQEDIRRATGREVSCYYWVAFHDTGIPVSILDDRLELASG